MQGKWVYVKKALLSMALAAVTTVFTISAGSLGASASTAVTGSVVGTHATASRSHDRRALETGVRVVAKTGVLKVARAASPNFGASTYCQTIYDNDTLTDALGITLAKFQMNTYYCWNYSIVTYHSTWETDSANGTLGWSYKGLLQNHFHCYYANSNKCSGNYEQMQGNFSGPFGQSWQPTCYLEEIYNGNFSGNCSG
jgi:hypothetical protein